MYADIDLGSTGVAQADDPPATIPVPMSCAFCSTNENSHAFSLFDPDLNEIE
ncbi:hypothetical protein ACQZ42_32365 [Rhizobium rhizogenes]